MATAPYSCFDPIFFFFLGGRGGSFRVERGKTKHNRGRNENKGVSKEEGKRK